MIRFSWSATALAGLLALAGCSRNQSPAAAPTTASAGNAATTTAETELRSMSVDELAGMLTRAEPVTVIDNNGRERYEQGHIAGARWVGHDAVTAAVLPQDRAARVVFYCYNEH